MTFTDQPISKEERRVLEVAQEFCASHNKIGIQCKMCQAVAALDRARTPPKPKTLEDRVIAASESMPFLGASIRTKDAITVAHEYALEKMRECFMACSSRGLEAPSHETVQHCRDAIAKLIEEEGRR